MKISILTYGSRGDIQPFLPLSLGLMFRGHSVKLAAPSRFQDLVEGHGIQFVPLAGEPEDLSRRFNDAGNNFIKMISAMMDYATEIGVDVLQQTETSCEDADLIVHPFLHAVGAHTYARQKNIPDIHVQTFPMFTPTGAYPNVTLPDLKFPFLNRLSHIMAAKMTWWGSRLGFAQVRRRARLPQRKLYWPFEEDPVRPPTPILCAWSPSLIPASAGWPDHVTVTGWYFFDSNKLYSPPAELDMFLKSGEPPRRRVHAVGAGPAPIPVKKISTEKLTRAILEAETYAYCARAVLIGKRIRSEDGVDVAVRLIEKHPNDFHRKSELFSNR